MTTIMLLFDGTQPPIRNMAAYRTTGPADRRSLLLVRLRIPCTHKSRRRKYDAIVEWDKEQGWREVSSQKSAPVDVSQWLDRLVQGAAKTSFCAIECATIGYKARAEDSP